ncbi:hypothetical protein PV326_001995 [Microctonus aethiopoides]|nr:hypothetical protein PV326_001995 [Microctonus aethiopoides]
MNFIAVIEFNIHIPLEWIDIDFSNYEYLINHIFMVTAEYADHHGSYSGCVIQYNNINAALFIDNARRMWWFRRIQVEDDPRPPTVNYYPPLASLELEEEWRLVRGVDYDINNIIDDDNDDDTINIEDIDDDDTININIDDDDDDDDIVIIGELIIIDDNN